MIPPNERSFKKARPIDINTLKLATIDYIRLEPKIKKGISIYYLIDRSETCAIYQQWTKNWKGKYGFASYEVFKIKIGRRWEIGGRIIERRELFPTNEAFGNYAWTIHDFDIAYKRFLSLPIKENHDTIK